MRQKIVVEIKSFAEKIKVPILKKSFVLFILVFMLSFLFNHKIAAEVHVHHHAENEAIISLNNGSKWSIDESLHVGMTRIRNEIANNLEKIHYEQFSNEQYAKLAITLESHLNFLFKNCKLPPLADAQLHTLLAKVMLGVDRIKHSNNKKQGAVLIIQALQDYPVYFADSNWQNLFH